jgi:hypothetical protein
MVGLKNEDHFRAEGGVLGTDDEADVEDKSP